MLESNYVYVKIDKANFKPKRLILIHGAKHPKTGKAKVLFDSFEPEKINELPDAIIHQVSKIEERVFENNSIPVPVKCPFIEYACSHALEEGTERNLHLVPNVDALTQDISVWQCCADVQNKSLSEFENWAKRKPKFNCKQLQAYAGTVEKRKICDLCLLNRGDINGSSFS